MKPIILACAAMVFYASQNVVVEQKLARYNTLSVLVYFYLTMLPLALVGLGYLKATNQKIVAPTGSAIFIALAVGAMFFLADAFYVGAYEAGGTLMVITTIMLAFPALASLMKYLWVGGLPNNYQIVGYVLAALGVLCVTKGNAASAP